MKICERCKYYFREDFEAAKTCHCEYGWAETDVMPCQMEDYDHDYDAKHDK